VFFVYNSYQLPAELIPVGFFLPKENREEGLNMVNGRIEGNKEYFVLSVMGRDQPGIVAVFGGLFGEAYIIEVRNMNRSSAFVGFGGRIPAPITSIRN
jgi:uncharacterized protein